MTTDRPQPMFYAVSDRVRIVALVGVRDVRERWLVGQEATVEHVHDEPHVYGKPINVRTDSGWRFSVSAEEIEAVSRVSSEQEPR